ncbi:transketolase [Tunicatimonas pelagia]|uniref:transketolase n=1 Tax=Tunicatimonas pelagia TaxID=931531 RepID=UPI002664F774|nr:transketolase [Tunicatimonas pelagia]WKN43927.1 transketolase [Tunicatimonas pelagia]
MNQHELETLCINTIRTLSMDAVQKANSGHPGTAMSLAPIAHVLWSRIMNYNPDDPHWPNRDRFILSAGHACILQYSILHLTGYDLSMDDLKDFRQWESKTAGHPEYHLTPGIEVTTGPLGQGFANGVGFAIGQKFLAARYNQEGKDIFNYKTYAICSDGDLMEGISSEAGSLAGHLKLGNLIYLYDDNNITIDGTTSITFTEDVEARFRSFGWHTQTVEDVNDLDALEQAIRTAEAVEDQPSLIRVKTIIAYGSPNKINTSGAHGAPLGGDEVAATKKNLGWDPEKHFYVPDEVYDFYKKAVEKRQEKEDKWNELFQSYKGEHADLAEEYLNFAKEQYPSGWQDDLPVFKPEEGSVATRNAGKKVMNAIAKHFPLLIGGAADLVESTKTEVEDSGSFEHGNYGGQNIHFGIREHAMGAIVNGLTLTEGTIAYGSTFFIFTDYMRPTLRLAGIMKLRSIFIYTHDSIGLGEDGTTHQPVEHLMSMRAIPNLVNIRPGDANETAHAWRVAIEHKDGPVAIVLTRQGIPVINYEHCEGPQSLEKGAYILKDADDAPQMILIASGSEVQLALQAQEKLAGEGIHARVVSMPSWELFEKQDVSYRESVFPKEIRKRISIEAGVTLGWHKYITDEGVAIGIDTYGESAPGKKLMEEFGFTVDNVVKHAKQLAETANV